MKWLNDFCLCIVLFFGLGLFGNLNIIWAQPYGNEWIDYSQTYYKFQSDQTGMHRIGFDVLEASGIPLEGSDFKLVMSGEEIPIYVSTDGILGVGDYIEFYGQINDGKFDTEMYAEEGHQGSDKRSLFADERTYYLVSDNSEAHLRFETISNDLSNLPVAEDYFIHKSEKILNQTYCSGKPFESVVIHTLSLHSGKMSEGEGWVGTLVLDWTENNGENLPSTVRLSSEGVYVGAAEQAEVVFKVVGRNDDVINDDQHLELKINDDTYVDDFFSDYSVEEYNFSLPLSEVGQDLFNGDAVTNLDFYAWDSEGVDFPFDFDTRYSVSYATMTYPHSYDFEGLDQFDWSIILDEEKYFEVENFDGDANAVLYDLTSFQRLVPTEATGNFQFKLPNAGNAEAHQLHLSSGDAIVEVSNLQAREFIDYSLTANQGSYLIISHPVLREGAVDQVERYVNHRESEAGGEHQVLVVEMEELYDQFAQGINGHSLSIRHFVDWAIDSWTVEPEYLNLVGKGIVYQHIRFNEVLAAQSLVPSYGFPPCDYLLTTENFDDIVPRLAVGRVPALDSEELRIYLDKVIEHESYSELDCDNYQEQGWRNNYLQLAAGTNIDELNNYESILVENANYLNPYYDLTAYIDNQASLEAGEGALITPNITSYMNEGLAMIEYVGHADPESWLADIGGPELYSNEGKYPFMFANGCFTNAMHQGPNENVAYQAIEYLMAEDAGAISFLGATNFIYPTYTNTLSNRLLDLLTGDMYGESLGKAYKESVTQLFAESNNAIHLTLEYMALGGDPAIALPSFDKAELFPSSISYEAAETTNIPLALTFEIENEGYPYQDSLLVKIEKVLEDGEVVTLVESMVWTGVEDSTMMDSTTSITIDLPNPLEGVFEGTNYYNILLDPLNDVEEYCEFNNLETLSVEISLCSEDCVWPGDTNQDGEVSNYDLFNIGWAYGSTGPVRNPASTEWFPQACDAWVDDFINDSNFKQADCDGNGVVNGEDVLVLSENYGWVVNK